MLTAVLNNANTATPNFVTDAVGDYVAQLVVTAPRPNFIATLPASSFDSAGHSTALTNQLQQAITDVQKDKISQAIGKIADVITRTWRPPAQGQRTATARAWTGSQTKPTRTLRMRN